MTSERSLLLVTGGEAVMRQTFREHGRAYWSAEFGLILEKHGWLDFASAGPEVLADIRNLSGYATVIVAWLPEEHWQLSYVQTLRRYDGILMLEGPFPPAVEEMLQVQRCGDPDPGARGDLSFSPGSEAYIRQRFGATFPMGHRSAPDPSLRVSATGDPSPLQLAPRESRTRRPGLGRDAYSELEADPLSVNAGRAAISLALAYRARFTQNERFSDDPVEDALALFCCVRCLDALTVESPLRQAFHDLVCSAATSAGQTIVGADERARRARAIRGMALVEAGRVVGDHQLIEDAKGCLSDLRADWYTREHREAELSRWYVLLAVALSEQGGASPGTSGSLLEAFIPASRGRPAPMLAWLDTALTLRSGAASVGSPATVAWLDEIGAAVQASSGRLPSALDGFGLPDLILTMGALAQTGQMAAARRLWRTLLRDVYDVRQGLFMQATVVDGRLAPRMGFATSARIALGLLDAAGPIEIVDGPTTALRGYTSEQVAAWSAPPYVVQPYAGADDAAEVSLDRGAISAPLIWRSGNVIATSFQLLAHLVHVHTVEPVGAPFTAFRSTDALVLEYLLIHLLGSALAERPARSIQTGPWPWGIRYALTIRHDVDRVLDAEQFSRLFEFERSHDLGVSWFWLPDRLEPEQLLVLARDPRHEIALHAVRVDQKPREVELVGRTIPTPIVGEAIHGSGDSWVGHTGVRAAVEAGLLYTELSPPVADRPYARYPRLDSEGLVSSEQIIGITYNISIDGKLGGEPGSEGGPGVYRQLLNHPDLNLDRLRNWVRSLPEDPHVNWTCEEVARWWQSTHSEGRLMIRHRTPAEPDVLAFEVTAVNAIEDLELRIPCRPEFVVSASVDGEDAEWAPLIDPEYPGIRMRMSLSAGSARAAVVRYARGTGTSDHPADTVPAQEKA